MAERTYPNSGGTDLDPKVFTHPVTGAPMPILVKDISGGGGDASAANQTTMINLLTAQASKTDTQPVSLSSVPLPSGAATGAKQDALAALIAAQALGTSGSPTVVDLNTVTQTPSFARATASGSVAVGALSVSVSNVGASNGTLTGAVLKPGETITFGSSDRKATLTAVAYDATGTEFIIVTLR